MTPQETLMSALKQGALAGSWVLIGTKGVGKKEFAKRLGAFLTTGDWEADVGYSPDIKWVQRGMTDEAKKVIQKNLTSGKAVTEEDIAKSALKKEITVDEIREATQFMAMKSDKAGWRLVVISLADEMNEHAQNALLKALEEPTEKVVVLLLCQNPGTLLPTILSRCRQLVLKPLPFQEAVPFFQKKYGLDEEKANLLARLSHGAMGQAEDLMAGGGLDLYQELIQFFVPFEEMNQLRLLSFLDKMKDERIYKFVKSFMAAWVLEKSKEKEEFVDLYEEMSQKFNATQRLNLDRKHTLLILITKIGQAL